MALWLGILLPTAVLASSVQEELGATDQRPSPTSPQAFALGDRVLGNFTLSRDWALEADVSLLHAFAIPKTGMDGGVAANNAYELSGTTVTTFTVGPEWMPGDHWDLSLDLVISPRSHQYANTPISLNANGQSVANTQLAVTNSSGGFLFTGAYDTAGFSDAETEINWAVSGMTFRTDQSVHAIEMDGQTLTAKQLLDYCTTHPTASGCTPQLKSVLQGVSATLEQLVLGAGLVETLFDATDLGLSGTYYFYSQDPTSVGFYSLATLGRFHPPGGFSLGNGLPLAPLQFTVRPSVTHRFGPLSAMLYYEFDQYVPGQGYGNILGGKLQYRFTRRFKAYLSFSGIADTAYVTTSNVYGSTPTVTSHQGSLAVGARWLF